MAAGAVGALEFSECAKTHICDQWLIGMPHTESYLQERGALVSFLSKDMSEWGPAPHIGVAAEEASRDQARSCYDVPLRPFRQADRGEKPPSTSNRTLRPLFGTL